MLVQFPTNVTFVILGYIDPNVTDILVTHGGMDTSVIPLQPEKAVELMLVTLEGILTPVIELQPEKSTGTDGCNRVFFDRRRDLNIAAGSGIAGNGDRSAVD